MSSNDAPLPRDAAIPVACILDVFTPAERERHRDLLGSVRSHVRAVSERPDGWEFTLDDRPDTLTLAAEWISLERRCCPFLSFALEVPAADSPRVTVTGPEGAKELVRAAFDPPVDLRG